MNLVALMQSVFIFCNGNGAGLLLYPQFPRKTSGPKIPRQLSFPVGSYHWFLKLLLSYHDLDTGKKINQLFILLELT